MTPMPAACARAHDRLLASLQHSENLLIIQDLDGVCMGLVQDPRTRRIDRGYVEAARELAGHFQVLTNGEHDGPRGVNTIVERAFEAPRQVRENGLYLPGLGAGGVQLQDRHGHVSHPGVSEKEVAFLRRVSEQAQRLLRRVLIAPPYALPASQVDALVQSVVLDNRLSPTVNINALHRRFGDRPARYRELQDRVQAFMDERLAEASRCGLTDAFFVHYAPNLGRDARGVERVSAGDADQAGTTDFQFMLAGAVKEAGVLVLLNRHVQARTGVYPLGEHFNVRQAPQGHQALLQLARERFDPAQMPRIVGVGDTVTSQLRDTGGQSRRLRGGSDRGFLRLVQDLGRAFDTGNTVIFVDSSGGEVRRPGVDTALLDGSSGEDWRALQGISDADDPLHIDVMFTGGHVQYVNFFRRLSAGITRGRSRPR